jgi:hypothetical protein
MAASPETTDNASRDTIPQFSELDREAKLSLRGLRQG